MTSIAPTEFTLATVFYSMISSMVQSNTGYDLNSIVHPLVGVDKVATDFPLKSDSTDWTNLKANIAMYWFGSYAVCIIVGMLTVYILWAKVQTEMVKGNDYDIIKWLKRFNN